MTVVLVQPHNVHEGLSADVPPVQQMFPPDSRGRYFLMSLIFHPPINKRISRKTKIYSATCLYRQIQTTIVSFRKNDVPCDI